jgi:YegS/Rv2252/BmrU family lipid kinase
VTRTLRVRRKLSRLDRRLLAAAIRGRSPTVDRVMTTASGAANRSVLWAAIAAVMAASGRRRARTAAASGLLGIGIAATLVNGPLKFAWRRDRPVSTHRGEPLLPLPRTFSFPSGHSASALAFATGTTAALPAAGPVLLPMAATVAYSRVHTGVHYPSDVLVGATVGAGAGLLGARVVKRLRESAIQHLDAPALDVSVPRHAILVTGGAAAGVDGAARELESAGVHIEDVIDAEDVTRLAAAVRRSPSGPLVVAAGGDGTVSAAANAIADGAAILAIVPLGTSNDVARSLGIPPDPVTAAQLIVRGQVSAVDVGCVQLQRDTRRIFVNAATIGLNVGFAKVASQSAIRNRLGGLTYPFAAAWALRNYEPFACELEYEGRRESLSAVHVSVSNAPVFGGVLGMRVPGADITDGLLDVTVIERLSITRLVLAVADTLVGGHRPVHGVHTKRVRSIRVGATGRKEIALDGEVVGELPASLEVKPAALRVVVPRP